MVWHTVAHMTNVASIFPEPQPIDDGAKPVNKRVGMNVSIIMRMRRITQKQLAVALGVTQGSMSRRINGTTDWSPDDMEKAAHLLSVKVARLFEELPEMDSNHQPAG
ncbi:MULTISPECIES: helix-turn-helix domain-containing protein [unclassified Pseudoclavibacter]|uniref:helix-turn-helix domain-containing protein n=1 Tax=unclassified Pseudoclavibacter TaxID=2615177 RepID=UPI001BA69D6C|nr:helix-turn-helix transcriptional regulator [Pseudoclavibacter sp. Marseille-Q4354]